MNNSSITKYVIGGVVVVALIAYVIFSNKSSTPVVSTPGPVVSEATSTTATSTATSTNGGSTSTPVGGTTTGQYKDGTYLGSVADAFYGKLQVSATISGGKLTDVTFPQYPSDAGESKRINLSAQPTLKQEAIAAQSANVNIVSGATQSSEAFNQSLAVALAAAKN